MLPLKLSETEKGEKKKISVLLTSACTSGLTWLGIIYMNVLLNFDKDYKEVILLAISHRKGSSKIMHGS